MVYMNTCKPAIRGAGWQQGCVLRTVQQDVQGVKESTGRQQESWHLTHAALQGHHAHEACMVQTCPSPRPCGWRGRDEGGWHQEGMFGNK